MTFRNLFDLMSENNNNKNKNKNNIYVLWTRVARGQKSKPVRKRNTKNQKHPCNCRHAN